VKKAEKMSREKAIQTIRLAFSMWIDRCCSAAETEATERDLEECLKWIKDEEKL
jgi:hypothetical protein